MRKKIVILIALLVLFNGYCLFGEKVDTNKLFQKIDIYRKLADKKIEKVFKYCSVFNTDINKIASLIGEYKLIFNLELKYIYRAKANGIFLKKEDFYKIELSARKNIEALSILLNIAPKEVHSLLREALNLTQKGRINFITFFTELNSDKGKNSLKSINLNEILREGGDK
ncbi:hypothetical protein NLD30_04105 [SCandidatus Aminicenantes bacterium Aminicenantia_JdfR_composite]|nr:hypothetical protein [SCandidatus Aminicenantes bacterium Aminicenantia_JdfR_composite]